MVESNDSNPPPPPPKITPVQFIVMLIQDKHYTFNEAFIFATKAYEEQTGHVLRRPEIAREVLKELERICK